MRKEQTLGEFLRDTPALTYLNAIKVTHTEIKKELQDQDELAENLLRSRERLRKLLRKFDNQYRVMAKLAVRGDLPLNSNITVEDGMDDFDDMKELMEGV